MSGQKCKKSKQTVHILEDDFPRGRTTQHSLTWLWVLSQCLLRGIKRTHFILTKESKILIVFLPKMARYIAYLSVTPIGSW